ncbi:MAG: HDOD domain-containing protein [Sulfuricurvum sp.]|nr:HDOD domain-containing protein [Sulfuricurvum sp.]
MDILSQNIQNITALPPIPDSLLEIQHISNDPYSSLKDLANVIQKDPMLTANILKLANAPIYGLEEHVNTIQQAISLFGISSIVGFAMVHAIESTLNVDFLPYKINSAKFLEIANMQNALAFHWKDGLDNAKTNIFLTASFLMSVGSLLISDYIIKENLTQKFQSALSENNTLDEIETEICGFSHKMISAAMFEVWDFDQRIVQAIRQSTFAGASQEAIDIVSSRLAVISAAVNLKEQLSENSIASAIELASNLGLDAQEFKNIIERISE